MIAILGAMSTNRIKSQINQHVLEIITNPRIWIVSSMEECVIRQIGKIGQLTGLWISNTARCD
jgi:hypothetical protein